MSVAAIGKTERLLERKSAGTKARLSSVQPIHATTKLVSAIGWVRLATISIYFRAADSCSTKTEMFFPHADVRDCLSYSLRRCAHQCLHANIGSPHRTIENLDRHGPRPIRMGVYCYAARSEGTVHSSREPAA
jgi:hypothetical protein